LIVAYLIMGIASILTLAVLRPTHLPPFSSYVWPLAGVVLMTCAIVLP
jgi:hypothetical protein